MPQLSASLPIKILYRDNDLFIVDKPPAMHSVGENSLVSALADQIPALRDLPDSGLVQRLDFETTGVLVGGFNSATQAELKSLLMGNHFEKTYLAVVEGNLSNEQLVEGYMFSRYRGSAKVSFQEKPKKRALWGRSLITPVNSSIKHKANSAKKFSLVRINCALARRHQVRVHLASIGHPLVGDTLYGAEFALAQIPLTHPSNFVLVAESVSFSHPSNKERVTAQAQLTADLLFKSL